MRRSSRAEAGQGAGLTCTVLLTPLALYTVQTCQQGLGGEAELDQDCEAEQQPLVQAGQLVQVLVEGVQVDQPGEEGAVEGGVAEREEESGVAGGQRGGGERHPGKVGRGA